MYIDNLEFIKHRNYDGKVVATVQVCTGGFIIRTPNLILFIVHSNNEFIQILFFGILSKLLTF